MIPPEIVSWESTLKCNLRCKHCGLSAETARPNELTTEEAKDMLIQLAAFGVEDLVISGGEFTTRRDWQKILSFSLSLFDSVRVITNGFMGKKLVSILENLSHKDKLVISLSLDGKEKAHDKRRGKGSFKRAREILEIPTSFPKTVITTVAKDNFMDLHDVLDICLKSEVKLWSIQLCLPEGRMKKELFLDLEQIKALADFISECQLANHELLVIPDDCFGYLHRMRRDNPWLGCHAGKRLAAILSDGSVTGCPTLLEQICGNIREKSFKEIWEGEKMEQLRNQKLSQCQECQQCPGGCKTVQKVLGRQFCF